MPILFILFACVFSIQLSSAQVLEKWIEKFPHAHLGLQVYNLSEEKNILSYNENKLFIPASNLKLYSYYVLNKNLSDSIVLLRYEKIKNTLFVKQTGEPTFLHPDFKKQKALVFLKNSDSKNIIVEYMPMTAFGRGWQYEDFDQAYQPDLSFNPIYGNILRKVKRKKKTTYNPDFLKKYVFEIAHKSETKFYRDLHENTFYIPLKKDSINVPFINQFNLYRRLLIDTLNKKVSLRHKIKHKLSYELKGKIDDQIFKMILTQSDNFITEQMMLYLFKLKGYDSYKNFLKDIKKKHLHFLSDPFIWFDTSGLSRYNLTSPQNTILILEKIFAQPSFFKKTLGYLSKAKQRGTLKVFFKDEPIEFYGKTGTLTGILSLSGYLKSKKGNWIAISVLANNFDGKMAILRKSFEDFFLYIYNTY